MSTTGEMLTGATALRGADKPVRAVEAATGEPMEPAFGGGTAADVEHACALAWAAFDTYRETRPGARAAFLEACAQAILDLGHCAQHPASRGEADCDPRGSAACPNADREPRSSPRSGRARPFAATRQARRSHRSAE